MTSKQISLSEAMCSSLFCLGIWLIGGPILVFLKFQGAEGAFAQPIELILILMIVMGFAISLGSALLLNGLSRIRHLEEQMNKHFSLEASE